MNPDPRIAREKRTIDRMIRIYCRRHHGRTDTLCEACTALLEYALQRLDNCPFQGGKPACNRCRIHCYSRGKKDEIKRVMRFSGPRMIYRHPILGVRHLLDTLREPPTLSSKRRRIDTDT